MSINPKIYILDDEEKAIDILEFKIQHLFPTFSLIRKQSDPLVAIKDVIKNPPDLLFLDIQMPNLDGFEFLQVIPKINFEVIFVTAFNEYAIKAIKNNALEYLLKPVDDDDLQVAIEKFFSRKREDNRRENFENLLGKMPAKENQKIAIHDTDDIHFVNLSDLIRLEGSGNYTKFFFENRKSIVNSKTLKEYEQYLLRNGFLRVHKSHIVNTQKIVSLHKNEYLVLSDGSKVNISRRRKKGLKDLLLGLRI